MRLELFDPALLELADEQRAHNEKLMEVTAAMAAIDNRTPEGIRWIRDAMEPGGAFGFQALDFPEDRTIPGPAGPLPLRVYRPSAADDLPVLVWYHGGGFVIGDLDTTDTTARKLANRTGGLVVSVDYRLGPEHRWPAAFEDAWAAFVWVAEHAAELGADATRIAVGGDSAGGNLSIAVCLRAREEGVAQPVAQVLVYPATDFSQRLPSRGMFGEGFYLSREFMDRCEAAYVAPGTDTADPFLSPLQAKDLSGLAPAYVVTAGFDPLRDEGEAFARRVADDGGVVQLARHAGLIHGFFNMVGVSRSARAAVGELVDRLRDL